MLEQFFSLEVLILKECKIKKDREREREREREKEKGREKGELETNSKKIQIECLIVHDYYR